MLILRLTEAEEVFPKEALEMLHVYFTIKLKMFCLLGHWNLVIEALH